MATPIRQLHHSDLEAAVFSVTRRLLEELGSPHAIGTVRGDAHLERDLGLGSLERVELLARIEREFGAPVPDRIIGEADTLDDVIRALAAMAAVDTAAHVTPTQTFPASPPAREPLSREGTGASALAGATTWQQVLRCRAENDAEQPHLILWEDGAESQRLSFGELYRGARSVAANLSRRGIRPGDTVALMLPTSRDFFLAFAGVWLAGGVPVPIYPPVRADRITEYAERQSAILRNAQARLLVTFREAGLAARLLRPRVPSLRGVVTAGEVTTATASAGQPESPNGGAELALLQYTSGSTGDPKGVMLTHANLLANVRAIGQAIAVRGDDIGVSWLPLYHDMGLIGAWLMPLYFGLPVVVLSPIAFLTRPERWLLALDRYRGTLTAAPNFAYELAVRKVTDEQIQKLDLSSVRAALNGAEPVHVATLERFAARFAQCGLRREALAPVYGLAEASLAVTVPALDQGLRVDRVERETFERTGRAVPLPPGTSPEATGALAFPSVGHPVPGHEVRIADASGEEAGERVEGALWFRGPSATRGYYRNDEATRRLFPRGPKAGWLDSGDRAYRADGDIFITGRVKDIIFKAGRNLYPHEVEEIAGRVAGVRKGCVAAFGAPDPAAGTERLIVVAETREGDAAARQRIAAAVTEQISATLGVPPDTVDLRPPHSIPKTSSGKLRRDHARRLYLQGRLGAAAPPAWAQAARLAAENAAGSAGRWLRRLLEVLYGIYATLVFCVWIVPSWTLVLLAPSRRAAARITSSSLRLLLVLLGCPVRVVGREHLETTPLPHVLVSNHTSYFDVLVLMAALGVEYHFVAKWEVHHMPFIGTFLRKLEHFAFDRSDRKQRLLQAEQIENSLRKGESVFVFPEGTFRAEDGVRPFLLGAFKAAAATGRPVLPVALRGTRQFLRDLTYLPRPSRVTITMCPPIEPQPGEATASWHEVVRLRDAAREAIATHAGEPLL